MVDNIEGVANAPPTSSEFVQQIFDKIKHENELVNNRLTWLGTFEGFLFASLSFAADKNNMIAISICITGMLIAISIGNSTRGANKAIQLLELEFDKQIKAPEIPKILYIGYSARKGHFWWLNPGAFVPWVLAGVWFFLLIQLAF